MVATLDADNEAKVLAAKSDRSRCAALKRWEAALAKYEIKLAKYDEPAFNRARFKIIGSSLERMRELSPRRDKIQTRTFCAFCLTTERCIPQRRRKAVAKAA